MGGLFSGDTSWLLNHSILSGKPQQRLVIGRRRTRLLHCRPSGNLFFGVYIYITLQENGTCISRGEYSYIYMCIHWWLDSHFKITAKWKLNRRCNRTSLISNNILFFVLSPPLGSGKQAKRIWGHWEWPLFSHLDIYIYNIFLPLWGARDTCRI